MAKDKRNAARARTEEESAALESMREGEDLLDHARALAKTAQIDGPISPGEDLERLELRLPPAQPDRLGSVNELVKALGEWKEEDPVEAWNEAVAREGIQREEALAALLRQGEELLARAWDQDECPLCEAPQDRNALAESVKGRAGRSGRVAPPARAGQGLGRSQGRLRTTARRRPSGIARRPAERELA